MTLRPAHFFDLGGTLLALDSAGEIAYDSSGLVTLLPGVRERLTALAGELVFVVTNQSGLADGTLPREVFDGFRSQLSQHTNDAVTGLAVCDHPRDAGCACRKPRPGLVLELAATHRIDLARSTLVGCRASRFGLTVRVVVGVRRLRHDSQRAESHTQLEAFRAPIRPRAASRLVRWATLWSLWNRPAVSPRDCGESRHRAGSVAPSFRTRHPFRPELSLRRPLSFVT